LQCFPLHTWRCLPIQPELYRHTAIFTSRAKTAFTKAGLFVLGNVVNLSLFGALASSFAGLVMIGISGFSIILPYFGAIHLVDGIVAYWE